MKTLFIAISALSLLAAPLQASTVLEAELSSTHALDMEEAISRGNENLVGNRLCDSYFDEYTYQTYKGYARGRDAVGRISCAVAN